MNTSFLEEMSNKYKQKYVVLSVTSSIKVKLPKDVFVSLSNKSNMMLVIWFCVDKRAENEIPVQCELESKWMSSLWQAVWQKLSIFNMNAFFHGSNFLENTYAENRHNIYKEPSKMLTVALYYLKIQQNTRPQLNTYHMGKIKQARTHQSLEYKNIYK